MTMNRETTRGGGMAWRAFWAHGRMCAAHPWEVIFSVITTTVAMISLADWYKAPKLPRTPQEYQGLDVVVMTILRCTALLYIYHQFRQLHHVGSKYILGIAGLFAVFSSFVFSCSVIKLLDSDVSDLKDALFFFLLLVDLSRASLLAQFALTSSTQMEVHTNIAAGMAKLGPSLTLDTCVEALLVGAGTLTGVSRLEQMCAFACMSIIVNYIVFMTFYPACLSLVLELSNRCSSGQPPWQMATLARAMVEEEKPNPVVQRVKVIMSAGLLLVHGITRWTYSLSAATFDPMALPLNSSTDPHIIVRWLNAGLDHVVFMVMLLALIVKYVLFESRGQLEEHLIHDSLVANTQDIHNNTSGDSTQGKPGLKSLSVLRQRKCSRTISYNSSGWEEVPLTAFTEQHTKETQTEVTSEHKQITTISESDSEKQVMPRSIEECIAIMNSEGGVKNLTNLELVKMVETRNLPGYKLETALGDPLRAVSVRRAVVAPNTACKSSFDTLPYDHYDYSKVMGVCCENVIGYIPVPVGVAGPLLMNGKKYMVPMATTEGCLVASTNRGCRALVSGAQSQVIRDAMTRAPSVRMPSAQRATEVYMWIRKKENFQIIKDGFDSTSRFARLQDLHVGIAGRLLYMRFMAQTGDAMGMNMVSKGTEAGLAMLKKYFTDLEVMSVSGNYCMDKKPSAINWIEGRGKSVVCEAIVPGKVVTSVLKTSVQALVEANIIKNLVGSSLAGSIGGNNAHAANIVAAVYIACGQDPAQVVGSSNCMTLMEACGDNNQDLHITVTMPSLEVGTVGGGTSLGAQAACLTMLGVKGPHKERPGENACQLAKIIAATVLAGELSLMAALTAGHLVKAHMQHNRGKALGSTVDSSSTTATCDSSAAAATTTSNSKTGDTTCDSVAATSSSISKTGNTISDCAAVISNSNSKTGNTSCNNDVADSNSKTDNNVYESVSATTNNSSKIGNSASKNISQLETSDNLGAAATGAVSVTACMDAANLNVPHTDDITNS